MLPAVAVAGLSTAGAAAAERYNPQNRWRQQQRQQLTRNAGNVYANFPAPPPQPQRYFWGHPSLSRSYVAHTGSFAHSGATTMHEYRHNLTGQRIYEQQQQKPPHYSHGQAV